ncbi:hypothetical protein LCGC14_0018290 [marine sediment metagenome]|uniref:ABC transmembrane type-2 domain-containing protein n=1 Tax=marine sediment metagenome TaxID=412755 RepID=A0A0F9WFX3_9ZZZZ|nr:ABC transporter permease [Phycisphaerae bacterium]HDZ44958.1 ABC transporter permease [Phycisphaerae bacterium]
MHALAKFFGRIYTNRSLIWVMARRELRSRYAGSPLGLAWSVLHPLMMIGVYWFVFSVGFKVGRGKDLPFIIIYLTGFIPWTCFAETITVSVNAIIVSPHLVKKTAFPTEILVVVHLVVAMVTHAIMLVVLAILLIVYGIGFSFYNLQFLYFLVGLSIFSMGLGWLVSALNVFYRDVAQVLTVLLTMWFWLTPIIWQPDMLPEKYRIFLKLNPLYYVVEGYRSSFTAQTGFWENPSMGAYFWVVALLVFGLGGWVFRRLKPDFVEAL